jgi:tetratricopeptide (TPR) repeat protein
MTLSILLPQLVLALNSLFVGEPLPEFHLRDSRNQAFSSADLAGHPSLLVYVKFDQERSQALLKQCRHFKHLSPDLKIVVICSDSTASREGVDSEFPILLDSDKTLYAAWEVRVFPSYVLLDTNLVILLAQAGFSENQVQSLQQAVTRLLHIKSELSSGESRFGQDTLLHRGGPAANLFRAGKEYYLQNLLDRAKNCFRESINADSGYSPPWLYLGKCYQIQGEYREAEASLRKADSINRNEDVLVTLAMVLAELGRLEEAETIAEEALDLNRLSIDAKLTLTSIYVIKGDFEEAAGLIGEVMLLEKKNPRALFLSGRLAEARGDNDRAIKLYRQAAAELLETERR